MSKNIRKVFVPCYKVVIKFYDYENHVFRSESFYVDYFLKDSHGFSMYLIIEDIWCIPYSHTSIDFYRL